MLKSQNLNKILFILILIINFICYANEEVIFSINNQPTTTIDLNQRLNYLSLLSDIDINNIDKDQYIDDLIAIKLFDEFAKLRKIKTKDKLIKKYYDTIVNNNNKKLEYLFENNILNKDIIIENITYDLQRKHIIERIINDRINDIKKQNQNNEITNIYNIEIYYFVLENIYNEIIKQNFENLIKKNINEIGEFLNNSNIKYQFFNKKINNLNQIDEEIKSTIMKNINNFYITKENYFMIGLIKKKLKKNIGLNYSFYQISTKENNNLDDFINNISCTNIEQNQINQKLVIKKYENIDIKNLNLEIFKNLSNINEKLIIQNNDQKYLVLLCEINYNQKAAKDDALNLNVQKIAKDIEIEFIRMKKNEFNFQRLN